MTVYTSHVPDIDLGEPAGLFTFIFRNEHLFDSNTPAFIDALTDERYSRAQLRDLCLRFAFGVKKLGAKRGQVAMIFRYAFSLIPRFGQNASFPDDDNSSTTFFDTDFYPPIYL